MGGLVYRMYPPGCESTELMAEAITGVPGGSGISYGGCVGTGWCSSGERDAPPPGRYIDHTGSNVHVP